MAKRGRKKVLTLEQQATICEMYRKPGMSADMIGRVFRVSPTTILRVVSGTYGPDQKP